MDSLTHIVLGACIGEAFAGRTVGKKAMLWGILAQSIPDIDFIASFWLPTADNLLAHRGFTHSILFAVIICPAMAFIAERVHRPHNITYTKWLLFFSAAVLMHIFLDAFNNYGVGWFEPFSQYRISFNMVYVADPFFSIAPAIAFVLLLVLTQKSSRRTFWWRFGLAGSALYLLCSVANKIIITQKTKELLAIQQLPYKHLLTTPAPLQNLLWFVVATNDSGAYTGYVSVLGSNKNTLFHFSPTNHTLLQQAPDQAEAAKLIRFSQGYYTVEKHGDTLLINDLRFGQIVGWQHPQERFAFYYYLSPKTDNALVVQRGRFAKWNAASTRVLIDKMLGN